MCIGFVSGIVESDNPQELEPGWSILNKNNNIVKRFYKVYDMYEPEYDKCEPLNVYISKSYDATSHFQSSIKETVELYERIMGEKLNLDEKIQRPPIPGMELE